MKLAQLGADVTIACRNPEKAFAAAEEIKAKAPGAKVCCCREGQGRGGWGAGGRLGGRGGIDLAGTKEKGYLAIFLFTAERCWYASTFSACPQ